MHRLGKASVFAIFGAAVCLVSLVLPWWIMSSFAAAGGPRLDVEASANLLRVTGDFKEASWGFKPPIETHVEANCGAEYWFGCATFTFIGAGSILTLVGIVKKRIANVGLALVLCGLGVYPVGLEIALNSPIAGASEAASIFQKLSVYSNHFGGSNFGLFATGETTQHTENGQATVHYASYLSMGFLAAIAGAVLMALPIKDEKQQASKSNACMPKEAPKPQGYTPIIV